MKNRWKIAFWVLFCLSLFAGYALFQLGFHVGDRFGQANYHNTYTREVSRMIYRINDLHEEGKEAEMTLKLRYLNEHMVDVGSQTRFHEMLEGFDTIGTSENVKSDD
ncbi:hypothetical protein [Ruficoccus sp. ZRK36]|uniref:hypothetical protein n=1 Tax=Ruficoccus sp. ZRK36 TaxID=2866311 RepID=UPI001C736737|nr:hypothetical protein [Ruficoccus sp. ZRK36]QYY36855.1 hypothetical protein K0V07_05100 [Ruficoccus sp. ZRK36]